MGDIMKALKPYLLTAYRAWAVDNNLMPYLEIFYDERIIGLPDNMIDEDNHIVLNVSHKAIRDFSIQDNYVKFRASFSNKEYLLNIHLGTILSIWVEDESPIEFEYEEPNSNNVINILDHRKK